MLHHRNLWIALLAIAVLGGCETTSSLDPRQAEKLSPDKAVIVFTVSHDKEGQGFYKPGGNVKFFVDMRDATRAKALPRGFSNMETLAPMMTSALEDVWARIFVREVDPGRIEFTTWEVIQNNGPMGIRSSSPKVAPPPIVFAAKAGTVTYIGNLHANILWAKNPFGMSILAGALPEIRNEATRDLQQVYKDYPALQGKVVIEPLPVGPWLPTPVK